MKINIYVAVFGLVALILVIAALSTLVFNKSSTQSLSQANLSNYGPAPQIQGIDGWINSPPLNLTQLRGKVVLIDFWTYSCINCIRTIPYLNSWYSEYGSNGLVIIGVSTPEFPFEHNYSNVANAVQRFGIKYPVALDNNYSTWDAYDNHYWPADYLIDKNGNVRYVSFGEGDYNQTENAIRSLLIQANYTIPTNSSNPPEAVNFSQIETPEIYLGYARARQPIGNAQGFQHNSTVNYTIQNISQPSLVYFEGPWYNAPDGMVATSNSSYLFLVYKARNLNIVASGNYSNITLRLDNMNLSQDYLGSDTHLVDGQAQAQIGPSRLYDIINAPSYGWHELGIKASPGFKIYTFTFG